MYKITQYIEITENKLEIIQISENYYSELMGEEMAVNLTNLIF